MHVDAAGRDNLTLAGDHLGSRSENDVDVRLHIGIARLAYGGNAPVLDTDVGLHNPPVIENERVGDDGINRALAAGSLRLAHAVADDFPATELHLLAIDCKVLFHLDDEVGIGEAHLVSDRWAKHLRVGGTSHSVRHARLPRSSTENHGAVTLRKAPMTDWWKPYTRRAPA